MKYCFASFPFWYFINFISRAREENNAMESQIVELLSGSTDMGNTIKELEALNEEMQRALD